MSLIKEFKQLMRTAHDSITRAEKAKEAEKVGLLRAGSAGALHNGDIYATSCGRLAQARLLGYQSDPTQEMRVMFNGGITLEDYLETRFRVLNLNYRKEPEEKGEITPGLEISGRPDFDVEVNGEWIGIEVKSLASPFSVIKQRKNHFPYMKHMLQAAVYMTLLNRSRWLIAIGHSFHVNQGSMKIPPDVVWYELRWDEIVNGFYITNDKNESATLPFTKEHVVAYYREILDANSDKRLMARPKEQELNVDTYSRCKYCPMQSACNEYEAGLLDFESWLARVLVDKEPDKGDE